MWTGRLSSAVYISYLYRLGKVGDRSAVHKRCASAVILREHGKAVKLGSRVRQHTPTEVGEGPKDSRIVDEVDQLDGRHVCTLQRVIGVISLCGCDTFAAERKGALALHHSWASPSPPNFPARLRSAAAQPLRCCSPGACSPRPTWLVYQCNPSCSKESRCAWGTK